MSTRHLPRYWYLPDSAAEGDGTPAVRGARPGTRARHVAGAVPPGPKPNAKVASVARSERMPASLLHDDGNGDPKLHTHRSRQGNGEAGSQAAPWRNGQRLQRSNVAATATQRTAVAARHEVTAATQLTAAARNRGGSGGAPSGRGEGGGYDTLAAQPHGPQMTAHEGIKYLPQKKKGKMKNLRSWKSICWSSYRYIDRLLRQFTFVNLRNLVH